MPACKSKTKFLPATFAWLLLLGTTTLFFYFPCVKWYILVKQWYAVPIFQGIVTLFVLINFSMATFMDPGVIPRASPDEDRDDDFRAPLYRNVEINGITVRMKWCVTCQFYRPPRCSHCSVCNNCIEIFDHHCPWVNNCIGRRNYRYFFMFLISLTLHMIGIFVLCLIHVLHHKEQLTEVTTIVTMIIMCIISLVFLPICGLTGFHIVLVARGRTTNEQVTGKFRGGYNPFSRNCCNNCCFSLCGPQYPSLKNPAKYVGRKPRKYTVPVPVPHEAPGGGPGPGRASGRSQRQPASQEASLAAQAAEMAKVRTYRDNGVKHSSSSYNRMSAASNDNEQGSDLDEPMASQSQDTEMPLNHNSSKSNFYNDHEDHGSAGAILNRSSASAVSGYTGAVSSPYQGQARLLQQSYHGSPHIQNKPVKRSGTPEHMLSEPGLELRAISRGPAAGQSGARGHQPPVVSSPGRQSLQSQYPPASQYNGPVYSQAGGAATPGRSYAPSTTYNPGYQEQGSRRYLSEGELLGEGQTQGQGGVGPSTSAGQLQELAGSPQRSFYMWKQPPQSSAGSGDYHHYPQHPPPSDPGSPAHGSHSYAQQVGFFLQQSVPIPVVQSGGPRTTPSGYPGGPIVPPGQVSPKMGRRFGPGHGQEAYTDNVIHRTAGAPASGPLTFTRALEVTDSIAGIQQRGQANGVGGAGRGGQTGGQSEGAEHRESVYDMNYEISYRKHNL